MQVKSLDRVSVQIIAERVTALLDVEVEEKRMFGGISLMLNGNMLCCASRSGLMVRVGAAAEAEPLKSPHAARCTGTGRELPGFLMVTPAGVEDDAELERWLRLALAYVGTLAPKPARPRKTRAKT